MESDKFKILKLLQAKGIEHIIGAISTGSGQELPTDDLLVKAEINYFDLPGIGDIKIPGHEGILRIVSGRDGDWAIWTGRRHFYQGYSFEEIGLYIDISNALGATQLVCLNAAGGLDPGFHVGQLVLVRRYRCFTPLPGIERTIDGGPWRETSEALGSRLIDAAEGQALTLSEGAYAGVPGPIYETAAEVAWLRKLGCHLVGMSTVPELLHASELGMEATAVSAVANVHGSGKKLTHGEVVQSGRKSTLELSRLIAKFARLEIR